LSITIVIFSYPKLLSFSVLSDLHKMKIKHRIIGEYETLFFRFKKADHRYWKLINYALTWARPNLFLSIFMPVARMLQHVVFVYLANTAVLCYSLIIICCCQVQNYIYWIISTENDHRHHHTFIKYEKRLRKESNMPRLTYQAKSLPLQREFGRIALP
jgi:hypothetical protein